MSLIDRTRQSEVNSYFKLEEEYGSLVDHARELDEKLKQKEAECEYLRSWMLETYKYMKEHNGMDECALCMGELFDDIDINQLKEQGENE